MSTNAEKHQAWLAQLTEQSKAKQEKFMNNISSRLGHPRMMAAPQHPFRGAPDFWSEKNWSTEQCIEKFTENFLAVGGHVQRCNSMEQVADFIADKAKEMSPTHILRQDEQELAALSLESLIPSATINVWNSDAEMLWKSEAAQADFGIVYADHAVAYTGSVVVKSAKEKGRSVSLLPTVLFIVIPASRMVTRLGEVLMTFDEAGRENLPAGIHFISGPSRSSDIENDLTIGVHGPGVVYSLIVG